MSNQVLPPAGVSPAGFFVPNVFVPPGEVPGILADAIDFTTGEYLSIEQGFDPTDAWVINALRVVRGSGSAVQSVGRDFSAVTHVGPRYAAILRQELTRALQPLIDAAEIAIESIDIVEAGEGDQYRARVLYRHVSTGELRPAVFVPLGRLIGEVQ